MKKSLTAICLFVSLLAPASLTCALTIDYTYDVAGRLKSAEYDIGVSITYVYDDNGNLVQRTANTPDLNGGPGDINADGFVNLADVIVVLKVLTNQQPNSTIEVSNSINGDSKIDIQDAIHILGEMANRP